MITVLDVQFHQGVDWYEESSSCPDSHTLCLVTYGKCVFWVQERKLIIDQGDVLLIPPQLDYYGKSIPTLFHSKYVIRFHNSCMEDGLPMLSHPDFIKRKLGSYELVRERLRSISLQWEDQPAYYRHMANALLTETLIYINQEWDRGVIPDDRHRHVARMKQYIQEHYRERITKEDLGEVIQRTPNYAATLFRSVTNQTISEYVHSRRIKTAMYMLTESRLTVQEVSEYLGYRDVSYFHRIFKKITGASPSDFLHERSRIV
ncbi:MULTISPECIES: helix-turn-helix transcriptional regulator [Paenibacillus]|uniref:Helix-turn-helix domain-containing protein n=1 Tax=Paenibacillus campinasensis TaxID=66347 RepID=A0ABW9T6N0_9BACL|nr:MULTISPECIES: AraC family transcriptional regulator [Paenibacillus]MUG68759.1 helix-turn-helix domain-containing protein [Paenibacillus campinasensis]PAK47770.1 AraC family transcriptional regulator [Paenibacillus sp. 7541]